MGNLISNHNCLKCFDQVGGCSHCKPEELKFDISNQSGIKVDMVNHPPHYQLEVKGVKVEVIDAIAELLTEEEYIGYLKGNCLKYQLRADKKGGKQDWQKAAFYFKVLDKLLKK